jgi:hypothetical protein
MSIGRFLGYGIFGILALLVVLNFESVFAQQNNTIDIETPAKVLPIYKESKGTLMISRDGAFEGPFNTTYSVTANRTDFAAIGELIKSAIVRDFDRTPNIGYIKTPTPLKGYFNSTIEANLTSSPYATIDQINKQILEHYTFAQDIALKSGKVKEIRCVFGDQLIDFKCEIFPAIEHLRSNLMNESYIK